MMKCELCKKQRFINYYFKQKDWWRNMDNMSEATLNLVHMSTPKQRVDRMVIWNG